MDGWTLLLLVPVLGGAVFSALCWLAMMRFRANPQATVPAFQPPLSVLKPCYGLDRDMAANLHAICTQDYPDYQVVLSVQRPDDPCLPLLQDMARRYPAIVTIAIETAPPTVNGKVQNMIGGLKHARHDVLVISDSDARPAPDYLRQMVAPLADPAIGYTCSLYRAVGARTLAERLEVLGINGEFVPSLVFAWVFKASPFCLGASTALRRADLDAIGGLPALADFLVEDYEMGRRLRARGLGFVLVPTAVDLLADYPSFGAWWSHWVYWDQNTKAANPVGFAATVLTRAVPFAVLFALANGGPTGLAVLLATLGWRWVSAWGTARAWGDEETIRALPWLPLRDCLGLIAWALALTKRHFVWRGHRFRLMAGGRIAPRDLANATDGRS